VSLDSPADLKLPVTALRGVGSRVAEKLRGLGIETVQDLLFHLPSRYEDRTRIVPLDSLRHGERMAIEGRIESTEIIHRRRRMMLCHLSDGTGSITLRFFHFSQQQRRGLSRGMRLHCYGEVRSGFGGFEMVHPEYQRLMDDEVPQMEESLTAIYPATEGIHQLTLRNLIDQALTFFDKNTAIEELMPAEMFHDDSGFTLAEALQHLHRPPPDTPMELMKTRQHPCQRRLAFEELLAHNVSLRLMRKRIQRYAAPAMSGSMDLCRKLLSQLNFDLTDAQARVSSEIIEDLRQSHPMMRLVQGDVGSGKTVIAAIAALQAIESGYQVAFMAPTEILAEQHFRNMDSWLTPLDIELAWLSGKQKGKARRQTLYKIESGKAGLVVGTHALFQEEVVFDKLGLVIVDEQHRFGVYQRLKLMEKGTQGDARPHQMIMTATPIPRTLAMTAYTDLDTSIIDELPPGRQPITTAIIPEERRSEVIERTQQACTQGHQIYWVCPLIEDSEALQAQAATETEAALKRQLPNLKIRLIHGRLKSAEKEQVMQSFKAGDVDLLVATTVIEVGVDVPNASLMIIENAERLGLSQLHQLRGRVGRSNEKSSCVLMYKSPLGNTAKERLSIMRKTNDGFEIARRDLEIRGPGEVLGTRQTGVLDLRIADLIRDQEMIPKVAKASRIVFDKYPQLIEPLLHRWLKHGLQFAEV